jgi:isoaspartyl peptidase/L-asparaginase-like protein (Ntn-hydrolase superfamily)
MKLTSAVLLGLATLSCGAAVAAAPSPLLVIHGGAGVERKDFSAEEERAARAALTEALRKGHEALMAGKPAMDAVTAAITVLEDDPTFNAGRGAVFTHDGKNELDSSLMDGATLRAGAVAGVHTVKNPILLARAVMEHSPHVMMVGEGAEMFAAEQKIPLVDPSYFRTEKRWQQLQRALKEEVAGQPHADLETAKHFGTVGAVALDREGKLAAGTSTGGVTGGWVIRRSSVPVPTPMRNVRCRAPAGASTTSVWRSRMKSARACSTSRKPRRRRARRSSSSVCRSSAAMAGPLCCRAMARRRRRSIPRACIAVGSEWMACRMSPFLRTKSLRCPASDRRADAVRNIFIKCEDFC